MKLEKGKIEIAIIAIMYIIIPIILKICMYDPVMDMAIMYIEFLYAGPIVAAIVGIVGGVRKSRLSILVPALVIAEMVIVLITGGFGNIVVILMALIPVVLLCLGYVFGGVLGTKFKIKA